jgi:ABC-2 type transport system permease protein
MQKLWLIVRREYITRVRKKSFIIGTLLAPVGLLVYFVVIVGLSSYQSDEVIKVALLDEGRMIRQIPDDKGVHYVPAGSRDFDQLKEAVRQGEFTGILRVPELGSFQKKEHTIFYYSDGKLAPEKRSVIERRISEKIREYKIDSLRLDRGRLDMLGTEISIDPERITGQGDDESKYTAGVGLFIGGIMAFIMFFMVMMYGQMVMRSVMEEKTNRIVEVMMSSVRPFELMLGKILGTGAVGLTQVLAWIVLSSAVWFIILPFALHIDPQQMQTAGDLNGMAAADAEEMEYTMSRVFAEMGRQNWPLIISSFVIFFLGGYFIYSSMFAAIGSAMGDDFGEGQALVLPITIPIILAFYITAFVGIRNPDSGLMVFASLFPLFSPIVMPFRMAFDPPWWQVLLSLVLVVAAAIFFVYVAGRIYRVGILLYGKKVTFKEIGKWMWYKG